MSRSPLEVADVIRRCGKEFLRVYGPSMTSAETYVLKCLAACRTSALGGHIEQCDRCGHKRPAYNSCRNRHCPKCQSAARADWMAERQKELLPVPYYHVVFTLPGAAARIALQNKKLVYDMLFAASAKTLHEVATDPKHLGAKIGFLSVLHTWGQNLDHHPHVHCLVPGGGLSQDEKAWIPCRKGFFLSVRVLSKVFRGKFLALLKSAYDAGELQLHGSLKSLRKQSEFQNTLSELYEKDWVVYAKPPFGSSRQVLKYLARYTNRVAISNDRLVRLREGEVTFLWKNYANGNKCCNMTLRATEFLRRFLLHLLPSGFVRIRHYGWLSNRSRKHKLARCRQLLETATSAQEQHAEAEATASPTIDPESAGDDCRHCPSCRHGQMHIIERIARPATRKLLALPWPWDTS